MGLYYYVARFYDPALAHFVQADTVVPDPGSSLAYNRYAYVDYAPLNYADPDGHWGCRPDLDGGNCGSKGQTTFLVSDAETQRLVSNYWYGQMSQGYNHVPAEVQNQVVDSILENVVSIFVDPVDYYYTAQDIIDNGFHWYHVLSFAPIVTNGAAGHLGNHADELVSELLNNLPIEWHHILTNKSKQYTSAFNEIVEKYGLDLDGEWNKVQIPHRGRHINEYHDWVLQEILKIDNAIGGGEEKAGDFLRQFDKIIKQQVTDNPQMLRKSYWR